VRLRVQKLNRAASITACAIFGLAPRALATTYYVSPTGNDNNTGTSSSSPWQSVTKIDATTFQPGDQILFQAGGNWYGSLNATSSGTAASPITYGSYGSGADPTFWGSNIVSASSFQPVSGATNTYTYSTSTPVTSFFVNDQFTHSASLVSGQTTDAGNISYVENNPNTWYYSSSTSKLYVNTGSSITSGNGNVYSAAVRANAINCNALSNVIFQGLETNETAAYNGGYGINVMSSNNIVVQNCIAMNGGKHNVGIIDSNATVSGTLASGVMPDQGIGGATAFVSYSDLNHTGNTSVYNNCTVTNYPNEQAFYDHADTTAALASVTLNNFTSIGSPIGIGVGSGDHAQINGGLLANASLELNGNTTVDGMRVTGANAYVGMTGSNNVMQNVGLTGVSPSVNVNPYSAAILDQGTNDVIRDSTIVMASTAGSSVGIELVNAGSNFSAYGNVIVSADRILQTYYQLTANPVFSAPNNFSLAYNVYDSNLQDQFADVTQLNPITLAQMQSLGLDTGSMYGIPVFLNPATGQYELMSGSPGVGLVPLNSLTKGVLTDINGATRPQTGVDNAGAFTQVNLTWKGLSSTVWDTTTANWNNTFGNSIYTDGANVTFNDSNNGHYSVTLSTSVAPETVSFNNSSGSYTLGGSGSIGGAAAVTKAGTGTATLNTANTNTGGTTVSAGTLVVGVNGALGNGPVKITGGTLKLGTSTGTAKMTSLSISGNGTFDIANDDVRISYTGGSPIASIAAYIASGYHNGAWNGTGIISTTAAANHSYGVGYADSADPGNPAGLPTGTIEIRYTLLGDIDLNTIVNGIDFGVVAANFNKNVSRWDQGDFNYDNIVNGLDFSAVAANFDKGASGASSGEWNAVVAFAQVNGLMADVPEPGSMAMVTVAAGMLSRRRIRSR
jgi:autotransporter-associated beta strand protein